MKRVLGIDFGDVRIGIAMSDELNLLAHPLETLDVRHTAALPHIRNLVAKHQIETVVLGLPRNMDGSHGPAAEKVLKFAEELRLELPCQVVTWDERLSTVSAKRSLQEAGRKAKQQKNIIDQVAAQVILQSWLDAQTHDFS